LFSFSVKHYSSPYRVEGGVKFLYIDALRFHVEAAREQDKAGGNYFDSIVLDREKYIGQAPLVLLISGSSDQITDEEIADLYNIVRLGKRSWPMNISKTIVYQWLAKHQDLIGVDYFEEESDSDSSA
jgi:hypothetical protein